MPLGGGEERGEEETCHLVVWALNLASQEEKTLKMGQDLSGEFKVCLLRSHMCLFLNYPV